MYHLPCCGLRPRGPTGHRPLKDGPRDEGPSDDPTTTPTVDVRRAQARFTSRWPWLDSKHSFTSSSCGVLPDESNVTPGYEQLEIEDSRLASGLVPVASGMARHADETAIRIRNRYAPLQAARLQPGQVVELPQAP
jgi:hypothetical protein